MSLAEQLRADPIAAGQIRESIPVFELLNLLGIDAESVALDLLERDPERIRDAVLSELPESLVAKIAHEHLTNYLNESTVRAFYDKHGLPQKFTP